MCKARHILSPSALSLIIFLGLLIILEIGPVLAQRSVNAIADNPASLSSRACKQYLAGNGEESLALYQKAIVKAESEYGKNARVAGSLYYEMGVRALALSKFNLAERCFKKATEINPHSEAAQLMLVQLLRFRDRDTEAATHAQQLLKKRWDSKEVRRDLMLCLQDKDPAGAARQAFIINCLQNDTLSKIPGFEHQASLDKPVESIQPDHNTGSQSSSESNKTAEVSKAKAPAESAGVAKKASKDVAAGKTQTPTQIKGQPPKAHTHKIKTVRENKTVSQVKAKSARSRKGGSKTPALVPPPPPIQLGFPGPAAVQAGLKAKAASMKPEKAKETPHSEKQVAKESGDSKPAQTSETQKRTPSDVDPDFLLDWAAIKKKPGKK